MKMSNSDMASKLIAVIVEQRNQIVELESQISRTDKANTDLLGQYVEAAERARELEIEQKMSIELLTPEVVDGWKRVATAQLENYRERIVIPTTLLLAMINKIQANEAKNEHG